MIDPEYPESAPPAHRELREILSRAVKEGGRTAIAAEKVRGVLYPHRRTGGSDLACRPSVG